MANTDFNPPPAVQQQVNPFAKLIDIARQGLGMRSRLSPEGRAQWEQPQAPPSPPPAQVQAALPPPSEPMPPTKPVPAQPSVPYAYIPPKADTPPQDLGKPWWPIEAAHKYPGPVPESTHIPSPRDSYRYIGQGSAYLAKMGAPAVAGPAQIVASLAEGFAPILDWLSQGGFSRNYGSTSMLGIQRQLGNLKVQQEQFLLQTEIAAQKQQEINERYGRVFNLATTMGKDGKPLLSGDELEEAIRDIANIDQDNSVSIALDNGGLPQAIKQMQINRQNMLMLQAGHVALKKMTAGEQTDAEEQAAAGEKTDISGQGLGASAAFHTTQAEAAAPVQAPEEGDTEGYDQQLEKQGYTEREIQDIHQVYNGGDNPWKKNGTIYNKVIGGMGQMNADIHRIAAGPADDPEHPENSKIEQIRRIDPGTAATIEGLKNYSIDPVSEQLKGGHRAQLVQLASQLYPGYKQGFYKEYQTQWLNQSSPTQYKVTAANRVGTQLIPLMHAINALPINEDASVPSATWSKLINGQLHGDPVYGVLNDTLGAFARESIATQTGSRGGTVAFVNQMMQGLPVGGTKAQLRAAVRASVIGTDNIVTQMNNSFKQASGLDQDMPGFDPKTHALYNGVERMNPYTGKFPPHAPEDLKIVSPESLDPEGQFRKGRPSWMTGAHTWEPIDQDKYNRLKAWLDKNPDDPKADEMRHYLGTMQ